MGGELGLRSTGEVVFSDVGVSKVSIKKVTSSSTMLMPRKGGASEGDADVDVVLVEAFRGGMPIRRDVERE